MLPWKGLRLNRSQIYILFAVLGFSFILIFSTLLKLTGMSSVEQLLFRLTIGFVVLWGVMGIRRTVKFVARKNIPFFSAIGFTYALFALSGLSAIAFNTPIPVSVALVYTQPIFTAVIAQATGKERLSLARGFIVVLGVLGAFLVAGLLNASTQSYVGIGFAVFAGFLYAIYLRLKRQAPMNEYTPFQVLFNTFAFAIPFLLLVWLILRNFTEMPLFVGAIAPDSYQLVLLVLFAVFCTVLPYGLLNYVKPGEISPTSEGLLLLGDPLLHTLWATLFFREIISTTQYLGAALILASAVLNLRVGTKAAGKR